MAKEEDAKLAKEDLLLLWSAVPRLSRRLVPPKSDEGGSAWVKAECRFVQRDLVVSNDVMAR